VKRFQIRTAVESDLPAIHEIVPRFVDFDPPPWRDASSIVNSTRQFLAERVERRPVGTMVRVAHDESSTGGAVLGFIHCEIHRDPFTGEPKGYVSEFAVRAEAEGTGVAAQLMEEAEVWARENGARWLSLNVFERNARARRFYEREGFVPESVTYLKVLR